MNPEKLDQKAMMMIVLACTAIVLGVLIIDMQIAKQLAARAKEINDFFEQQAPRVPTYTEYIDRKRVEDEIARRGGTGASTSGAGDHPRSPVERNSGVETGKDSPDSEIPMEGWDVFPVDRSAVNGSRRIGNLEVPQGRGTVEP